MDQRTPASPDDAEITDAEITAAGHPGAKKPYVRPQLVRLGAVADMTRTVGNRRAADGGRGRGRNSRTSW